MPIVPNNPTRRRQHPFDRAAYRQRNLIERWSSRLKDFRRIAPRHDKPATDYATAVRPPSHRHRVELIESGALRVGERQHATTRGPELAVDLVRDIAATTPNGAQLAA